MSAEREKCGKGMGEKRKSKDKREEAGKDKGKLGQMSERSRDKLRVCNESIDPKQKVEKKKPFQKSIEKFPSPHRRRENPFQERQSLMEDVRKNLQQRIFSHIAASLFVHVLVKCSFTRDYRHAIFAPKAVCKTFIILRPSNIYHLWQTVDSVFSLIFLYFAAAGGGSLSLDRAISRYDD